MKLKTLQLEDGETVLVEHKLAAVCEKRSTSVSSSAWEFSGRGSLDGESLSGTVASVRLTATGCGELKNTATLTNGEVVITWRPVRVRNTPVLDYA